METIELAAGEPLPSRPEKMRSVPEEDIPEYEGRAETVPERLRADADCDLEIESTADRLERQTLTVRLGRYLRSFPDECAGFKLTRKHLERKGLGALRELAQDVQHAVGTRRTGEQLKSLFLAGVHAAELTLPILGLEVAGLTNIVAGHEDLLKTVDELAISRDAAVYVLPEIRLAAAVAQICLALDSHNRAKTPGVTPGAAPLYSARADNVAMPVGFEADAFQDL